MKKLVKIISTIFLFTILGACSTESTQENLQANNWNVVSTTGEAYTASFGQDTVTFEMGNMRRGFSYSIEDDNITLEEMDSEDEAMTFTVDSNNGEYTFTSQTEEVKEQIGDLTLSPINE